MAELGVRAEFTDEGQRPLLLNSVIDRIEGYFTAQSGIGFNLHQAIRLLPRFKKYDVIFSTVDSAALPILALKHFGLIKKPVVFQSIGLMEHMRLRIDKRIFRWYQKWVQKADIVICFTYSECDAFINFFNAPNKKIRFLLPVVDIDYFTPSQSIGDTILSVGRDRFRDYALLAQAVQALRLPSCIITSPANMLGIEVPENVDVIYDVSMSELLQHYQRARFVVVPVRDNIYSAGSSVFLQAMAMGKACIISSTKAILRGYESLRSGENCILVKPGDSNELKSAIKWLWTHQEKAADIGMAARKTVERYFTPEQYAKALADIFGEVLRNHV